MDIRLPFNCPYCGFDNTGPSAQLVTNVNHTNGGEFSRCDFCERRLVLFWTLAPNVDARKIDGEGD